MYIDVFIGLAHDETFDFDRPITSDRYNGFIPTILYGRDVRPDLLVGKYEIFWDLVANPLCKNLDWGSWGLKRSAKDMILFLERYEQNKYAQYLIQQIEKDFIQNGLEDVELVLDAVET